MVALITSIVVVLLMVAGVLWYARRRPAGTPLTWGQAMAGAVYVYFLCFLIFGVVPHQWLTLAENELNWRADRLVFGPGGIIKPASQGGWFPMDITYRTLSDSVAGLIYVIFFGGLIVLWLVWQNRGQAAEKRNQIARSTYGRPLVKQG